MRVLITGANRGIGNQLAQDYARQGHEVIATTRGAVPEDDANVSISWVTLDVLADGAFAALADTLDGVAIDLLICNAGVYPDKGHDLETGYPANLWAEAFAVNATGVFLTIQTLLPNLQRAENARIAIISSQMASQERAPGGSYAYRASKAAVLNIGRNLAVDLQPRGIAVGVYHPGWVRTDMGGGAADIDAGAAARGLIARFDALSLATTGCFETWDGRAHPF